MGREPSDSEKVQAPSVAEIKDAFAIAQKRLARKVSFRGRKMGVGPLLNAVVIHFLSLPEDEQERIAGAGVARYEELLGLDDPADDPRFPPAKPPKRK